MELKRILCAQNENIAVHGRTSAKNTNVIPLFWSASAIEVNAAAGELWLEYECHYNNNGEAYLRVEVDGADMTRFMLEEGVHKACLFRGYEAEQVKNVCVYRECQASDTEVSIIALYTDGELHPVAGRGLKIEFLGDSVTSGEGLLGAKDMMLWLPCVFGTRDNYALLTAKALHADWRFVSQSGWGIYCSFDNNPEHTIPKIYEQVCGVAQSPAQIACGSQEAYDFSAYNADVVVVNLGANDCGAFDNEEWTDEEGRVYKQKLDENGKPDAESAARVAAAVYDFCRSIRKHNPRAKVLWCYNLLSDRLEPAILGALEKYKTECGDNELYTLALPQLDESTNGSRFHPGPIAHRIFSLLITEKIKEILG